MIAPFPDIIRCSRSGCTEVHAIGGDAAEALEAGWVMVAGQWICPEHGRLDGIDQGEPEEADGVPLEVDPEQTLDMPTGEP